MAAQVGDFSDRFLLTIHGVASDNAGLAKLRAACEQALPGLRSDSYFYQNVLPYRDITPVTQRLIYKAVRDKLELVWLKEIRNRNRKLFVVAHSFGTLALIQALGMRVQDLQIEGLILLGSIIPRDFYWDGMIADAQPRFPPLAIIRPFDRIVPHAHHVRGEPSGSQGFISNGMYHPREIYKSGGHTSYFPDDVPEVIAALCDGTAAVPAKDLGSWKGTLGRWKSFGLRLVPFLP